jgi:hypothetical protein
MDNNVQNLLIDPTELRTLKSNFTPEETKKFFAEMPKDLMGPQSEEEVKFDPAAGLEASLQQQTMPSGLSALGLGSGVPQVQRAFIPLEQKKEDGLFEDIIKTVLAAGTLYAGASALPGLIGGGSAAGAGGAGAAGAGGAGAAGAGAAGLTGVVPTGLIPGAVSAAGLGTATFPIVAGAGLSAAEMAALAAAAGGAGAVAGSGGASTGSTASTPTAPEAPLEEVVITAPRPPIIPPAVVAPAVGALTNIVAEPSITEPPLEEVVIETTKPTEPPVVTPPVVTTPSTPVDTVTPEGPLDEVVIETTKPTEPPVITPPVVTTPSTPVDTAFPEGPVEEVVVETTKPTEPTVITPPIVTTPSTPVDTAFPEGPIEEVTVEAKKPVKEDIIVPPVVVPPTTPVEPVTEPKINKPDPLQELKDKYLNLENFLKLLGALGSAASKAPKAPTPTAPTGGMGGALPKYTYTRQQLSPDIDYYTYGTRPEAKFFDYTAQLEKPVQPELPPAKPPGEDVPMATGGLTGYAKGGSNKSRYVAGPGSGREDKIPALLSDGEYVIDAETLALLGDGSTKEGARRMDAFRANIRKHKGRALSRGRISPNAKSPSKYMGGGLT